MDEVKYYPARMDYPNLCKPYSNADRIRNMTNEELVVFLDEFSSRCIVCAEYEANESCPIYKDGYYCRPKDIMEWLQQPAEEADNETVGERKDGYGNG